MIDLFAPAAADRSIAYLREIFGHMGGVLSGGLGGSDVAATSITILGTMFQTFNTIVLGVGALILVYVTIVGVVKTAHEGEMLGKQWSSLWLPLRMVLGIASLIPANAGFSTLQVVMMWVIVQGVGAADTMWNTVLGYVEVVGSPTAQVQILQTGADRDFQNLYKALACDATFREKQANPSSSGEGNYYCNKNAGSKFCREPLEFDRDSKKSTLEFGPNGACGTLKYCNEEIACKGKEGTLPCKACAAQKEALAAIVTGPFKDVAELLVQYDYSYRNFYNNNSTFAGPTFNKPDWIVKYCADKEILGQNCCVPGAGEGDDKCNATANNFSSMEPSDGTNYTNASKNAVQDLYWQYGILPELQDAGADFVGISQSFYFNSLTKNVVDHIQVNIQRLEEGGRNQLFAYAQNSGWIMAGTLYYMIAKKNNDNLSGANPGFSVEGPDESIKYGQGGNYGDLRQNYHTAEMLISAANNAAGAAEGQSSSKLEGTGGGAKAGEAASSAMKDVSNAFMNNVAPDKSTTRINPLIALQQMGYSFLLVATLLWLALMVLVAVLGAVGSISPLVLGTGLAENPIKNSLLFLWSLMLPAILGLLGVLITVGGMFAVYVPLIPYVLFTMGAIGWFLSVLEAMVAGPLVALGILMPGGQNEMLGKAEPSLMLLFSIFLRPTLMIFGLVASMLLAGVVVDLINAGFGLMITSIADVGSTGKSAVSYDAAGKPYVAAGAAALFFNPLMLVIILCAYTMLIVTALNKCFSAIHVIPEKVMRWIGGQGEQYGEAESMGQVKGGIESGQRGVDSSAGQAKGAGDSAMARNAQREAAKEAEAKKSPGDVEGKNS